MEESTTYQAIVRKGRAEGLAEGRSEGALEEARKMLLRLGRAHLQTPTSAEVQARVEAILDLEQLEELLLRVPQVRSWDELSARTPKPRRRKRSAP